MFDPGAVGRALEAVFNVAKWAAVPTLIFIGLGIWKLVELASGG